MRILIVYRASTNDTVVSCMEGKEIVNRFRVQGQMIGQTAITPNKDRYSVEIYLRPVEVTNDTN